MSLAARIEGIIGPTLDSLGFALVRIELSGQERPKLQIMVERSDGAPVNVEDCATISRAVSALLDVEDPVRGAYVLEVSSPGIDRPLVKLGDFERFAGYEAKVHLGRSLDGRPDGRRKFRGRLLGVVEETVRMTVDGLPVEVPFADIQKAKLVLTDELLAAQKEREKT